MNKEIGDTYYKNSSKKDANRTLFEMTMAKIRELPDPLIPEVSDFIDFLQLKSDGNRQAQNHQGHWTFRRVLF